MSGCRRFVCFGVMLGVCWVSVMLPVCAEAQVYAYVDDHGSTHFSDQPRHKGYKKHQPKRRPGTRSKYARSSENPAAWDGLIERKGLAYGVSPALVKAVIRAESNFNRYAVSRVGAQGLMQLMPGTAAQLGVKDPFSPAENIDGGTRYLSYLMKRFPKDPSLALAAYNAGENAVLRFAGVPPYPETRQYVKRVLRFYRTYDADFR